jgi:Beta-lactamase enzyme family
MSIPRFVVVFVVLLVLAPAAGAGVPRVVPHLPTREDTRLAAELERLGSSFHGAAALFVEDLATGSYAGWNENETFPAASTVKLGVIAEAIRRFGYGPASPVDRDLRAIGQWSSNEAANRVFALVGGAGPTEAALHRLGMFSSTYPAPYVLESELKRRRAPSAVAPRVTWRVTTARDLARALPRHRAAGAGRPRRARLPRAREPEHEPAHIPARIAPHREERLARRHPRDRCARVPARRCADRRRAHVQARHLARGSAWARRPRLGACVSRQ